MSEEGHSQSHTGLYGLMVLMTLIWSANYAIGKFALREIPSVLAASLRLAISGVLMSGIYVAELRRTGVRTWTRKDVPLLLMLGIVGVGVNQIFFIMGLARTSVAHAAIMFGLTPVLVLLLAAAIGQERLSRMRLAGMATALVGVITLQLLPANNRVSTVTGDLIVFVGMLIMAGMTVVGKVHVRRLGGTTFNTFAYAGSAVVLLPLIVYLSQDFDYGAVSLRAWASLLYMAVMSSIIAYSLYFYGLARIPASRVSAFSYLQPLFATLIAIPTLGETPTVSVVVGGVLVLSGVVIAERL